MKSIKLINLISLLLFLLIIGGSFSSIHKEAGITMIYAQKPATDENDKPFEEPPVDDAEWENSSVDDAEWESIPFKDEEPVEDAAEDAEGGSGPVAYLTFDDGPSKNTLAILKILDEYKIPATFFVIGKNLSGDKNIYRRILHEGHALGNHTYTHAMGEIYKSAETFMSDLIKLEDFLYEETGFRTNMMRFPGGSSLGKAGRIAGYDIMGELIGLVESRGYDYFDWNIDSGDGLSLLEPEEIVKNVSGAAKRIEGDVVILFHDSHTRESTVEALPEIIEYLIKEGYEFLPLSPGITNIKHR